MIATETNPAGLNAAHYIDFLSRGFSTDWDRASFEWHVRRPFNGQATDVAIRSNGTRLLAGATYSYRHLCDRHGRVLKVCIMGAGATLPAERGRGHYSALLQAGLELCRRHGCCALLGFTTHDNPSARGLRRLGAHAIPSYYIVSARRQPARGRHMHRLRVTSVDALRTRQRRDVVSFSYASRADWCSQFWHRPNPVRALRLWHDCTALIEGVGGTDRLQWLECPAAKTVACMATLAAASAAGNRQFFMYTLDPLLAQSAARLGLRIRRGLLNVLPVDPAREPLDDLVRSRWHLHSGDRM